jgi:cobalt/nickel transport system permease protein
MHIPDGFLSNRMAIAFDALSGAGVFLSARRMKLEASARIVPMMGVLAAFVFAAQMLNFPVLGGTSGHLVGGALLAILLGPVPAALTMATVIIAQAFFLQDGGLIALGANIFNIGTITSFSGYAIFRLFWRSTGSGRHLAFAAFAAGWVSMMLSAAACAIELALSGAIPLRVGLPAMVGYHALIGIAEGGLTAGVLAFLARVRPDLIEAPRKARLSGVEWAGALIFVAIPLAILALAGGSALPDPLQKLIESGSAIAGGASGVQALISTLRFREYFWEILVLIALIFCVFLGGRILHGRKAHP